MSSPAPNYSKTYPGGWQNGPAGGTPIDAAALNDMEGGIAGALQAPLSPAAGDVPIWDPTANGGAGGWNTSTNIKIAKAMLGALGIVDADVAAGAALQLSKLNGFPNDATKFARGDGVWAVAYNGPKITASLFSGGPPGSPSDGDVWQALAVDTGNLATTNGTTWTFRYNNSSGSSSKWEFVGGTPLFSEVTASESTATGVYTSLTTVGPSVVLSRAGDYLVAIGAWINPVTGGNLTATMSYDIGGTGAVDADGIEWSSTSTGNLITAYREREKTGIAASTTLTAKYKAGGGGAAFSNRYMRVVPVRIS